MKTTYPFHKEEKRMDEAVVDCLAYLKQANGSAYLASHLIIRFFVDLFIICLVIQQTNYIIYLNLLLPIYKL